MKRQKGFIVQNLENSTENRPINVLIAIQARSNSTRFPQKIYQLIGKKMVLQHVIDQVKSAKNYTERATQKKQVKCQIAILHPHNDIQVQTFFKSSDARLIAGDENDVLSRYLQAQKQLNSDYVVRLTSDCPLILDFMISKHINVAVFNEIDYASNVHESCRQVADGFDVEIMSRRAMKWLEENAFSSEEREHVTLAIRNKMPSELKIAFVSSKLDTSHLKLSLDTEEDLERIREYYHNRENKMNIALRTFGRKGIYEI